jgi:hypothetical protein
VTDTEPRPDSPGSPSSFHHHSHRRLLAKATADPGHRARVDAIVVPTARPTPYLRNAIALAAHLRCALVVLGSKRASVQETAKLAHAAGIELVAIDVGWQHIRMPAFDTTKLVAPMRFVRKTDTSLKRNLGLLFTHLVGWQRIVFLDDDITVPDPEHLNDAARLLDRYPAVGLSVGGMPDNSVVCHAYREVGGPQDTFIGGGALAVSTETVTSFFPDIYNEDWFFLLDGDRLLPSAVTGRVWQKPYDPFANDQRARAEEFGDCLAEGVFALLDGGGSVVDADAAYWRRFLNKRMAFISEIIAAAPGSDQTPDERRRMVEALKAARGRCKIIEPRLCVNYLRALRADVEAWRRHVDEVGNRLGTAVRDPEKVLAELGLLATYLPASTRSLRAVDVPITEPLDQDVAPLAVVPAAVG